MYNVGDIVPYYNDWDSENPQLIEGYCELVELLNSDDIATERIYHEMPENKQKIYYVQTWKVKLGTRKKYENYNKKSEYTITPIYTVRKFSILKQIGIHKKTDELQNEKKLNKYAFQKGNVAKIKNIVDNTIDLITLSDSDIHRIYNNIDSQIIYRPVLLEKTIKHLINNEEFWFDSNMNIHFMTINCSNGEACPIKYRPKYLHHIQSLYKIITNKDLKLNLDEIKKIIFKKYESIFDIL